MAVAYRFLEYAPKLADKLSPMLDMTKVSEVMKDMEGMVDVHWDWTLYDTKSRFKYEYNFSLEDLKSASYVRKALSNMLNSGWSTIPF